MNEIQRSKPLTLCCQPASSWFLLPPSQLSSAGCTCWPGSSNLILLIGRWTTLQQEPVPLLQACLKIHCSVPPEGDCNDDFYWCEQHSWLVTSGRRESGILVESCHDNPSWCKQSASNAGCWGGTKAHSYRIFCHISRLICNNCTRVWPFDAICRIIR